MTTRPQLPAGKTLTAWLREGGRPDRGARTLLWLYRWRAIWLEKHFSMLRTTGPALQSFPYADGEGLIFILGFWRSGTTLLHELLSKAPNCEAPRTWQCMDPSLLLLPRGSHPTASLQRPMDQVQVASDSPQEDEFALMAMGVPSVYQGFLDPRRLPELTDLLNPDFWDGEGNGWLATFEAFLAWCRQDAAQRMVVKSPNHVFRVRQLMARYPRARFIWLFRSPWELWRSNVKMWRAMIDRYALWHLEPRVLTGFLEQALDAYGQLLANLPAPAPGSQAVACTFEDLTRRPEATLGRLSRELDLGGGAPWFHPLLSHVQSQGASPSGLRDDDAPKSLMARLDALQQQVASRLAGS